MNICYLIRSFSNQAGTESYVYYMSRALAELGHQVHIISLTGKGQRDFSGFEGKIFVHHLNFKRASFKGSWLLENVFPLDTWRYGQFINKILPDLIDKHAIDIIEATDWGIDAWAYLTERKVPVCVRLHGYPGFKDDFDRGILKKWPKNYFLWSLFRKHLSGADLVTGVSESYTDFVRNAWELKERDVQIIPISVNLNVFRPAEASRENQAILFAGRLEKSKGIEVLAQAIPLVLKELPGARFYLAGRDYKYMDSRQTWSQYLMENFGKGRIIYLGSLPTQELVHYYQSATICVVPSLYEPGGTAVFEAMACGCPVIASKVGGLVEIIKDGRTGDR
ncbi:MAG: glycosyltransferase family 4 protein [Elusimicrobia bacterium]|nr:glycosyltransferase family 4 protein [Elusimicrobiota bacterium]